MPLPRPPQVPSTVPQAPPAGYPKRRFMFLLALLLGMLVLAPLLEEATPLPYLDDIFLTAVLTYAAYSFNRNKLVLAALIGLALPAIFSAWAKDLMEVQRLTVLGGTCNGAFFATLAVAVLLHVFREKEVSWDLIAGAIVVYLLMAVMWSQVYFVLETLRPGAFSLAHNAGPATPAQLRYFSIVTITTVGYGDIVPVSSAARAFANLEAIVGQLYLVIQVAWLVGMHVSKRSK